MKTLKEWKADPSTSTAAPICGAPALLRTYPEIAPGLEAAETGITDPTTITRNPSFNPSLRSINPTPRGNKLTLYSTANVADGSTVCLDTLSFTLI